MNHIEDKKKYTVRPIYIDTCNIDNLEVSLETPGSGQNPLTTIGKLIFISILFIPQSVKIKVSRSKSVVGDNLTQSKHSQFWKKPRWTVDDFFIYRHLNSSDGLINSRLEHPTMITCNEKLHLFHFLRFPFIISFRNVYFVLFT